MTWGSSCPQCGRVKCGWTKGAFCEGGLEEQIAAAIREAVEAERAACAEVARNYDSPYCFDPEMSAASSAADDIAKAIEERD